MKTQRYRFEREIEQVKKESKAWLREEFKAILESDKHYTRKADYIGFSIASIDDKVKSIDEEIKELQQLKKNLKEAKEIAQEVGAEVFAEYGVQKLEGIGISSITINEMKEKTKEILLISNEDKLIELGYFKKVLDEEKVKDALLDADNRQKILAYADIKISKEIIPAKLRINKKRGVNKTDISLEDVA